MTFNNAKNYLQDFERRWLAAHPDDKFLPPFFTGPIQEAWEEQRALQDMKNMAAPGDLDKPIIADATLQYPPTASLVNCGVCGVTLLKTPEKPYWIAISGYPLERAYVVYRFFSDIGRLAGKSFTKTNAMYLKYAIASDCLTALSYNGQRIGYGGDIPIKVVREDPASKDNLTINDLLEEETQGSSGESVYSSCDAINVEAEKGAELQQEESKPEPPANTKVKSVKFWKWLKKLVSMFSLR